MQKLVGSGSNQSLPADCVEKGHFLKNGFVIKIIFYLKQLFKNLAISKNGLKTPKTDFFNRIGQLLPLDMPKFMGIE